MNELNLIPSSLKSSRNKKDKKLNVAYSIIIVFAILFFGAYFPFMQLSNLQTEEADLKSQVDSKINVLNERDRIVGFVNATNQLIAKVENFDKSRVSAYRLVTSLQRLTPSDVMLNDLNYTSDSISMTASSKNYYAASIFVGNLQENEIFKNAILTSISKDQNNVYTFSVNVKIK
jgi:Tfp pilus assembly protein PilN